MTSLVPHFDFLLMDYHSTGQENIVELFLFSCYLLKCYLKGKVDRVSSKDGLCQGWESNDVFPNFMLFIHIIYDMKCSCDKLTDLSPVGNANPGPFFETRVSGLTTVKTRVLTG